MSGRVRPGSPVVVVLCVVLASLSVPVTVPAQAGASSRPDSIARLPGAARDRDTTSMLAPARLAALPAAQRAEWARYVERSRQRHAADRALIDAELAALGRTEMTRAPDARESFAMAPYMTEAWFRSDSARRLAEAILTYQTASGGWSKHADFSAGPRRAGQSYFSENTGWNWIATIDNDATTAEMRFLARADRARPDARYQRAFLAGLGYLLDAQFPNGCWPQVYPLSGGYHDAATFNDDATVNVLRVLRGVADGEYPFVSTRDRRRADAAAARGVDCLVAAQVVVNGARTAWGQQHDPLTLAPTSARSYELTSLASKESSTITDFLMELAAPDRRVVEAVHSAADWFGRGRMYGYEYEWKGGLRKKDGAGPLWARMYEIGTNRPIFANRDGVKLYDWEQLTDRRSGYGWYTDQPNATLKRYAAWARLHPRGSGAAAAR